MNNLFLFRRVFFSITILGCLLASLVTTKLVAQPKDHILYACVINNKSFVVGADNPRTGLFYTTDNGKAWHHMGWTNGRPFGIAVDTTTHPTTIYLAEGNGVHKSMDGGKTWAIKTGWEITEVQKITIDSRSPNILYIATPYGVWKSTDGGERWVKKNKGLREVQDTFITSVVVDRLRPSRVLISTENGIFESTDGGDSWRSLALQGKAIRRLVESPMSSSVLLAGTEEDGVFLSVDGGKTWLERNNGLKNKTIYALAVAPNNPQTFYVGGFKSGVYKSTDEGKTWKNFSQGLTNLDVHAIAVSPSDSRVVYVGTIGGGVFRSDDGGGTWKHIGLESCLVWDLKLY